MNSLQQTTAGGVSGGFDLTLTSGAFGTTATGTVGVTLYASSDATLDPTDAVRPTGLCGVAELLDALGVDRA